MSKHNRLGTRSVWEQVARNPVARAIERKRIQQAGAAMETEIRMLADWEHCPSLAHGLAETIAIAIKSIEGWDDPDDIGGVMLRGIERVTELSGQGFVWRLKYTDDVCNALQAAIQILTAQDPRAKLRAWRWAQEIEIAQRIAQELAP